MSKKLNSSMKKKLLSIGLLTCMVLTLCAQFNYVAGASYQFNIEKGTEQFKVAQYDQSTWKDSVGTATMPDDIFGGKADKINAESKYTIKATYESKWTLIDILSTTYLAESLIGALMINLSIDDLSNNFDKDYTLHYALRGRWKYTTSEFKEESNTLYEKMPFFKDPKELKDALNEYNNLVEELNNTYLSKLSADEFLYTLLISGIGILSLVNAYLTELVDKLNCKHTEVEGNSIIMERSGREDYKVKITYNDQGIITSILFTDKDDKVFYEITGYNSQWIVSLIFGIMGIFVVAIAIVAYNRLKTRK